MMPLAACLLALVGACAAETMWNPDSSAAALDAVEGALHKMADNPRLTKPQLAAVSKVVSDVDAVVAEFQSGKKLSQKEKSQKFGMAMQELEGLQKMWSDAEAASVADNAAKQKAFDQKEELLEKELVEKQASLQKVEGELKLDTLQKELLEKKLQLSKLEEAKAQQAQKAEDDAKTSMVAKLAGVAKSMGGKAHAAAVSKVGAADASKASAAASILADVKAREAKVEAAVKDIEADEKAKEADLDATMKKDTAATGKVDLKAKQMLGMLKKQVHREFKKAKAIKEGELKELKEAVRSIEAGDVAALQKLAGKMQGELKNAEARGHKFLV